MPQHLRRHSTFCDVNLTRPTGLLATIPEAIAPVKR